MGEVVIMKNLFAKENFISSTLDKKQNRQYYIVRCLVCLLFVMSAFTFLNMFYCFVDMVGSIVSGSADVALKDLLRSLPIFFVFFMTLWSLLLVHAYFRNATEERRKKSLKKNAIVVGCFAVVNVLYILIGRIVGEYLSLVEGAPSWIYPLDALLYSVLFLALAVCALVYSKKYQERFAYVVPVRGGIVTKARFVYCLFVTLWMLFALFSTAAFFVGLFIVDFKHGYFAYSLAILIVYFVNFLFFSVWELHYNALKEDKKKEQLFPLALIGLGISIAAAVFYFVALGQNLDGPSNVGFGILPVAFAASVNIATLLTVAMPLIVSVVALCKSWPLKKVGYRIAQRILMVAMCFMNWKEPELLEGEGAVLKLPEFIKNKGLKKVLVVTDKGLMGLHLLDPMFEELKKQGIEYVVFDEVQANPTIPNIEACKDMYLNNQCEGLIAFGGGSPMDCAKAAAARVVKPRQSVRKMRGYLKVGKKLPPFFAVPTTAGTGSENTLAAVVTDPETHEKNAICDTHLRPKYAVLDPALTVGLPPHITSTTGMDALTHAVESYIGKSNVKSTIKYAEDATVLIHENLEKAYANGKDMVARENMLKASFYAGSAFTRAFVGYVHAIAHNLGGMYNTPHGLANAVILPYVLEWYGKSVYKPLSKLADLIKITTPEMSAEEKAKAFIAEIRRMNKAMNIPEKFDFIKEEDIPTLVKRALLEGNPGYPVPKIMDEKDCEAVIRSIRA